jgi:3-deoxy-D-manno-octulosonic-acid transferase
MYLPYSLLLTLGLVILLPRFAVDALRAGKYVTGLRERLGRVPLKNDRDEPLIWLHCVSVGETEAAKPLVKALSEHFPLHRLAVSTTTVTGQQVAKRAFKGTATVFYFPLDLNWIVRRVLRTLRPSAILIIETELWPNLLRECHRQSIPVALVNGRISENSFRRYRWIRSFMRRVLSNISVAIMQSEGDADRIRELGMPIERVLTHGNLKFDGAEPSEADLSLAESFRDRFGFSRDQNIIVAASTHDPEETIVIEAFRRLIESKSANAVRLIIAPRHPERFEEIAKRLDDSGLRWSRRSAPKSDADRNANVVLLDSIGELRAVYALADVAFVGGSIAQRGGHNVLEPASQGVCTVTGPHMNNFAAITNALLQENAIVQLPEVPIQDAAGVLASTLRDLLESRDRRQQIGRCARAVCDRNRGATEKTVQTISHLLHQTDSAEQPIPLPALRATATK